MSGAHSLWLAQPLAASDVAGFSLPPPFPTWQPLGQPWLPAGPAAGFNPGWARISWQSDALIYEALFIGAGFCNAASTLNQRTWELGDVFEIFVQPEGAPFYIEVHVTPENQRLQLRLPLDGIQRVRSGQADLEDFMIAEPDWLETNCTLAVDRWSIRARLPATMLLGRTGTLGPASRFRTAVCRYDYRPGMHEPRLSTTAPLPAPSFHCREHWQTVALSETRARPGGC